MNGTTKDQATSRIDWSDGAKGGVGQPMMPGAAVNVLLSEGRTVLRVEGDSTNPDVLRA